MGGGGRLSSATVVGGWRGAPQCPAHHPTLLAARLDQLDAGDRGVLSRASVVGQEFEQTAIEELSPPEVRPRVHGRLLELVAKQLLRTAASSLLTGDAFQFRHLLLRDAAYEAVPKARRADLHERFAGWLEVTMGARAREFAEIIGYHYEQAVRYLGELGPLGEHAHELGGRAAGHLGLSGTRAVARGDMRAAANLLSRAGALPRATAAGVGSCPTSPTPSASSASSTGPARSWTGPSARRPLPMTGLSRLRCCWLGHGWTSSATWIAGRPTPRRRPMALSGSSKNSRMNTVWPAPGS